MLTMLIVDDEYLVRLRIKETIDWQQYGVEIVGEAADGEEGLSLALQYKPEIIIMDMRMPFIDGMELMKGIRENQLGSRIIVLSGYNDFDYAKAAVDYGADAYLLKPIDNKHLIETVLKVKDKIKREKSTSQYIEKLKREMSSVKKQLLRDLLKGNVTDYMEIQEKIQLLDLPLEMKHNYVIHIRIDRFKWMLEQQAQTGIFSTKNTIGDLIARKLLISSFYIGLMVDVTDDAWTVIVHPFNTENPDETIKLIKENCRKMTDELTEEFKLTFSVGISSMSDGLDTLKDAYLEAVEASNIKLLSGLNSIVFKGDKEITGYRREVIEAIKYIKNNYFKDISVETASKALYISPSYLMHLFKDELGKTFNECLTECRIEMAKELLKNPENRMCEICVKVGYNDVKYFRRVFKKITGINPSDYVRLKNEN